MALTATGRVAGYPAPVVALDPPTLLTMPMAFIVCIGVSLLDRSRRAERDRTGYAEKSNRMMGGAALPAAAE